MENPRPEKVAVVDEVRGKLAAADAALLTGYRGLTVKQLADLRRQLRPAGGEYKIYKNTLVRFAAREVVEDRLDQLLTGPTAIAFVRGDAAAVAKTLRDYARTNQALVLKGGLLGDKVVTAKDLEALADLPPRDRLLAQLAGAFQAPMAKLAGLLQALPRNFAYGLKALIDERGGLPDAAPSGDSEPAAAEPEHSEPEPASSDAAAPSGDSEPAAVVAEPAEPAEPAAPEELAVVAKPAEPEEPAEPEPAAVVAEPAAPEESAESEQPAPSATTADDQHESQTEEQ